MLSPGVKLTLVSIASFVPTLVALAVLWKFNALKEGSPLIVVLFVLSLSWWIKHLINVVKKRKIREKNGLQTDLPVKYEKVMSDPSPYEVLYNEKPSTPPSSSFTSPSTVSETSNATSVPSCSTTYNDTKINFPCGDAQLDIPSVTLISEKDLPANANQEKSAKGMVSVI